MSKHKMLGKTNDLHDLGLLITGTGGGNGNVEAPESEIEGLIRDLSENSPLQNLSALVEKFNEEKKIAEQEKKYAEKLGLWIRARIKEIAHVIGGEFARSPVAIEAVSKTEDEIINKITWRNLASWIKESGKLTLWQAMLEAYPLGEDHPLETRWRELRRLADMLLAVGAIAPDPQGKLRLCVTAQGETRGGRSEIKNFTGIIEGSRNLGIETRRVIDSINIAQRGMFMDSLTALREGAYAIENLSEAEAADGQEVFFTAPDGLVEKKGGETYIVPGGHVRVRIESGCVLPVRAVGKCAAKVARAAELGVCFSLESLKDEHCSFSKEVRSNSDLLRNSVFFHHLCRRGLGFLPTPPRREDKKPSEISLEECLLDRKPGFARVHFDKWEMKDRETILDLEFVIQRAPDGKIRVSSWRDDKLTEILGPFTEFKDPKENYRGIAAPLGSMLRLCHNRFEGKRRTRAREAQMERRDENLLVPSTAMDEASSADATVN